MCYTLETLKDIASIGASLGVIGASIVAVIAYKTYKRNNSIRRMDLIHKLYEHFLKEEWYEFYKVIQKNEPFDLNKNNEKLLNVSLTVFDEIDYYEEEGLLDEKALEYFACEILNFYHNETVMKYVKDIENQYLKKNFLRDIIPFTGFTSLAEKLSRKYIKKEK